jgi:hypothetical protein
MLTAFARFARMKSTVCTAASAADDGLERRAIM